MNLKLLSAFALAAVCALEGAALGQTSESRAKPANPAQLPVVAVPSLPDQGVATDAAAPAPAPCCNVPALTPIEFEILTPASSKSSHQGEQIRIRVIDAMRVDGKVVVPVGTEGYAEVIQASRGAFGGKAGELVIGAPFLMLGTQRLDLKRFRYGPVSGRDNTSQAILVSAFVGVFGYAVGGGNIDIQSGARANAVVTRDTFVPVQLQLSTKE